MRQMPRLRQAVSALAIVTAGLLLPSSPRADGSRTRSVFVYAFDDKGAAVTDLTPADFVVQEGGKAREVVKAEVSNDPLSVSILVDDNGSGFFRAGVAQFLQTLLGHGQFALSTVTGQTQKIVDYTKDIDALRDAISRLAPRPATPDGGQLLEGISEAAREQARRKIDRPVIVALTVGGEEHSTLEAHQVLDQLRDCGASLHVISVAESAIRSTVAAKKPSDMLDSAINIGEVLGDGPKQSGGRRDEIIASVGVVDSLQKLAAELLHQYRIVYQLPDGVKADERFHVTIRRHGVSVRAPSRIPYK
jgi:VWFA-related protein